MFSLLRTRHHLPIARAIIQPAQRNLLASRFTIMSDLIIADSPHKLQVLPHNQYETLDKLSPSTVLPSPLDQFHKWFFDVVKSGQVNEPEAVSLSTATLSGIPSARIVLFKQLDDRGFVFFTNYTSRKSKELLENPNAAMVFYWREVHKSVRVLGKVEQVDRKESESYFLSRPLGSQLGAWASHQSTVVGEEDVSSRLEKLKDRFGVSESSSGSVPPPPFWGGWRIVPK
jgi:pyridoxamine-phosphate oxidase